MKKSVIEVDKKRGVFQVTTQDDRFYGFPGKDATTGIPIYKWKPSVTWVCSFLPKDMHLTKWIASKGFDESQELMEEAGARGSKIHQAIEKLIKTKSISIEDEFYNGKKDCVEQLNPEEWQSVMAFSDWFQRMNPEVILCEAIVHEEDGKEELGVAGTVDLVCIIDGQLWIIDFKTGKAVYLEYEMQLSAYQRLLMHMKIGRKIDFSNAKRGVLLLNRTVNKKGWRMTETEDRLNLFKATKEIWEAKTKERGPLQMELPLTITI